MIRLLVLLTFLAFSDTVFSQFKNVRLNEESTSGADAGIAVNPRNPKNIVAVSSPGTIHYTMDGGATWQKSKISSTWGIYGSISLIADNKGNFYVVYVSDESGEGLKNDKSLDQVICHVSKDGGVTWDEGNSVAYVPGKDQFRPAVCIDDKENIYVTWTQFDKYASEEEGCTSVIMFSQSSNGKKWGKPVTISQLSGNCSDNTAEGAMPAVDSEGDLLFITWANQSRFFLDRSFNGGSTWLRNDIGIVDQPKGWKVNVPGHGDQNGLPRIFMDRSRTNMKGSLYLIWSDQRKGATDTDVWFIRSTNLSDNWTQAIRVNDDEAGKHQYLPAMAEDPSTGYIYVVFFDRRNYSDNQTDVYLAYSIDGGQVFKNVKISESPFVPEESVSYGNKISISANKGIITPVWTRTDNGKISLWTTIIQQADLIKTP